MNPTTKRILLVEDHSVVIAGIKMLLQKTIPNLEFEEANDGETAYSLVMSKDVDLIVMDVNMPSFNAFSFINRVKTARPAVRILVFSVNSEEAFALRFIKMGVNGYLNKEAPSGTLVSAVNKILEGQNYFSEELMNSMLSVKKGTGGSRGLSAKEFEVMHHLVKGLGISAIAKLMNLAPSTIATHKSRIFNKLGVNNVIELSQYAATTQLSV